jgi:hypothetical protein
MVQRIVGSRRTGVLRCGTVRIRLARLGRGASLGIEYMYVPTGNTAPQYEKVRLN